MLSQTTSYDHPTDKDQIDCVEQGAEGDLYPVLHIGATTAWPSREQLVAIRDAIQGYLDAHPDLDTPLPVLTRADVAQIVAGAEAEERAFDQACDRRAETPTVRELTDAEVQEMF